MRMLSAMSHPRLDPRLTDILRGTSRSFFLTLRVAPRPVRAQLGIGYLFCRAADTIADTRLLPPEERSRLLGLYRELFGDEAPPSAVREIASLVAGPTSVESERELLRSLDACFSFYRSLGAPDQVLLARLVTTLTRGMQMDLEHFPPEESGRVASLDSDEALDRYCYWVAGCVGEFWTDLSIEHLPALGRWNVDEKREEGIRFGKGLQLTNILRDVDGDLRIGRSYLPRPRLEAVGTDAASLREATDRRAVRGVVHSLLRVTLDHYRAGWRYTLAIPRRLPALRLACIWPLWIGLGTLDLIARADDPCAPERVLRVAQRDVYRSMASSAVRVLSDRALDRRYRALERRVVEALDTAGTT